MKKDPHAKAKYYLPDKKRLFYDLAKVFLWTSFEAFSVNVYVLL